MGWPNIPRPPEFRTRTGPDRTIGAQQTHVWLRDIGLKRDDAGRAQFHLVRVFMFGACDPSNCS